MTAYTLIERYKSKHPNGHYFDHDTLKFFGERISEMRVLQGTSIVEDYSGNKHEAYVLSSLQRNHPGGRRRKYSFFDTKTFDEILTC